MTAKSAADYWDTIAGEWQVAGEERTWRKVSDAVNLELLRAWLEPRPGGRVLKTDLFDEVAGDGLVPWLSTAFAEVAGVDISPRLIEIVRTRFPGLTAEAADVRRMPFADGTFDAVVSNSTLDHLPSCDDIAVAIGEIHRVTRPGGIAIVTLDNPVNPALVVRRWLPVGGRFSRRVVPFALGATCGPARLRELLEDVGFEVLRSGAVFHCPRLLTVLTGHWLDRHGSAESKARWVRRWVGFERLGALPTRYLTGYFIAALARKR